MEENKNKFWKGFLIGAFCFFVIGALAVLGITHFLEQLSGKKGPDTELTTAGGLPTVESQVPTSPHARDESTAPSTAIAPVTVPTAPTESRDHSETTPAAETTQGQPRTIDRLSDKFLNELGMVRSLIVEEQVLAYDMETMEQQALEAYVTSAGGQWEDYANAHPQYGPEVTLFTRNDPFLDRMGEIRELVGERLNPGEEELTRIEVETLKAFVAATGDVYSDYLTAEEWESTQMSSDGSYCGIGVQIMQDPETMESTVTRVFSNSPAREAGMLAGDVFKKVDGMDVTQMPLDQMVTYVRGHEGEPVTITVYREASDETLEFTCIRRKVEVDTVSWRMLTDTVGYLQLMEFDNVTISQTESALKSLIGQGMEKLVLDLRGNPGGLLDSVLNIADFFTNRGDLLFRMDYKNGNTYTEKASDPPLFKGQIVLLVDKGSASASEVLTGILQDYKLATVMGQNTFGKGIVQSFFNSTDGNVVKLTIAHYYSPLGRDFHGVGIAPDILVEDDVLTEKDEILEKALEYLK